MSRIFTSAEQVRILTDDLAREAKRLVTLVAHDDSPLGAVELLSPQALESIDDDLRRIAGVIATLRSAALAANEEGEPWNFVGRDEAREAAVNLLGFAVTDSEKF